MAKACDVRPRMVNTGRTFRVDKFEPVYKRVWEQVDEHALEQVTFSPQINQLWNRVSMQVWDQVDDHVAEQLCEHVDNDLMRMD